MPAMDPVTGLKECTACHRTRLAKDAFFRAAAMKDGYASRCKDCWSVRGPTAGKTDGDGGAVLPERPRWQHPAARSAHTHTRAEVRSIEAQEGVKCVGYATVGGMHIPVFGSRQPAWLDKDTTR